MSDFLFPDLLEDANGQKARKPERPTEPPKPDPVADALVQRGLVPNHFLLDLNKGLTIPRDMEMPYPWNLPSRLFIFPIEITDQAKDGTRRMGLLHPLLADHPYVKHVEATLGITMDRDGAPNEYGYSKCETGKWWHAVDLMTTGHWRDLLDTSRFTTPDNIAGAVAFGLNYSPHQGKKRNGYVSTNEAREIMTTIGAPEPADRNEIIAQHFCLPSPCKSEKGVESWSVNSWTKDKFAEAWGYILGIEAGYFAHDRAGFLGWTQRGRDTFPPLKREAAEKPFTPPAPPPPKTVTVLADEIAPRPSRQAEAQMDLF